MNRLTRFITPVGMCMTNLNSMRHYKPCVPCRHKAEMKIDANGKGYTEKHSYCDTCEVKMLFNKLKHYEDLEEHGRLIELPCKLKNVIDVIFSHNEIVTLMCDGVDKNGTRCHLHFWRGMAWNIPKEYLELQFVKIHGVVSDKPDTLYVEVDAKFTEEEAEAKLKELRSEQE